MAGQLTRWVCLVVGFGVLGVATCAAQGSAGQADLDAALNAKATLAAKTELEPTTSSELGEVISLLDSALKKGLDDENAELAKNMLASTLIQRGTAIGRAIFGLNVRNVEQLRRFPAYRMQALADLERAVGIDPNQPRAHLMIGRLHALPGGTAYKAEEAINTAIEMAGDDADLAVEAYIARGDSQQEEEKRLADYATAIELRPDLAPAYRARGRYLISIKKLDEGLADLAKAIELDPEDLGTMELEAAALAQAARYEAALASTERLLEASPESGAAYLLRSQILAANNDLEGALADADKAIELDSNNLRAVLSRVEYLEKLERGEEALTQINDAIEKAPAALLLVRTRGLVLARMKRLDEAIADFELIRDRAPGDLMARVQLATVYNSKEEFEKAVAEFDEAIKINAESVLAYQGRADAQLHLGRQAEAKGDYETALELNKENSSALNNLAWLLATSPTDELRDGKRAIELATQACELTEFQAPHILSTLAASYAEAGDFETALEWSAKAIELADDELKEPLGKEKLSYEQGKPWRESLPGVAADEGSDAE